MEIEKGDYEDAQRELDEIQEEGPTEAIIVRAIVGAIAVGGGAEAVAGGGGPVAAAVAGAKGAASGAVAGAVLEDYAAD